MSSGDRGHDHPIRAEDTEKLSWLLNQPDFQKALAAYTDIDEEHDCPDLGGSDNAGHTIIFDRVFVAAVKAGKFLYQGKPLDPRPYLFIHESVEGVLIRLLGLDYTEAHLFATLAERHAVESDGLNWGKYQEAFQPWIRKTEAETKGNWPPDLLLTPYKGTPIYSKLAAAQRSSIAVSSSTGKPSTGGTSTSNARTAAVPAVPSSGVSGSAGAAITRGVSDGAARGSDESSKLSHDAVDYRPAKPGGHDRCATCENYLGHACKIVQSPISPDGWCKRYEASEMSDEDHLHHQRMAIGGAHHLHKAGYLSTQECDQIQAEARAKLAAAKAAQPAPPAPMPMPAAAPAVAPPAPARPFGSLG